MSLTGCNEVICLNDGNCTPWLIGETDHRANCTCTEGYDGNRCQSQTTFSMKGNSYIKIPSNRVDEGYELHMRFRTTLGDGLVAIGQTGADYHFRLRLHKGQLNLYSNLISKFEGLKLGGSLNNTQWHKVYVAVNISHLTLGVNDRLQATQPINPTGDLVFLNTYIGGIVGNHSLLADNVPPFTGCVQDITVDGMRITEHDFQNSDGVEKENAIPGCDRKEQCDPPPSNPCQNNGFCTDLWSDFHCTCHRPFFGGKCHYSYTGGTFGHEDVTNSLAIVDIANPQPFASGVDISMFIRTRKEEGFIFYFGTDLTDKQHISYITGQLSKGNLVVNVSFDGKSDKFQVYTVNLSDGYRHFIRVVRMNNSMMVKVNETVSINHEIPSPTEFRADVLYLGNYPNVNDLTTTTISTTTRRFSTVIQTVTQRTPFTSTFGPTSSISPRNLNVAPSTDINFESEDLPNLQPSTSSILRRFRRQDESPNEITNIDEFRPTFFKGIIQDVQISNGGNYTKIVELFQETFEEPVEKPGPIGEVRIVSVERGVVSDNTCLAQPCANNGTCETTWNDYICLCTPGYTGRDCTDIEYCHWYTCPDGSICKSLEDGHECISNSTFNGVSSMLVLRPDIGEIKNASINDQISIDFRTQSNGTLLHIIRDSGQFIRVNLNDDTLFLEIPEIDGQPHAYEFGSYRPSESWHRLTIKFIGERVYITIDDTESEQITLDSTVDNLLEFVRTSEVIVGASVAQSSGRDRETYNLEAIETTLSSVVEIRGSETTYTDHYRGCLGELRIGGILIPYYTAVELKNNTASIRFDIDSRVALVTSECLVCFENECQNGGTCQNPEEMFECTCRTGFEDSLCSTNIDECLINVCINGVCIDGIGNYTCDCDPAWTGWLCDEDLDECLSDPCQNGGTCTQNVEPGNYTCECTSQYKGHNCDQLKNRTCIDNPCKNGNCLDRISK